MSLYNVQLENSAATIEYFSSQLVVYYLFDYSTSRPNYRDGPNYLKFAASTQKAIRCDL